MLLRLSLGVCAVLLLAGCTRTNKSELAIYDWAAQRASAGAHGVTDLICAPEACPDPRTKHVYVLGAPKLTSEDVDHSTVRAGASPDFGGPMLLLRFTHAGARRFKQLIQTLDDREADTNESQAMLVVIDNTVYSSLVIDFQAYIQGLPVDNGLQIYMPSMSEAHKLAKGLRGD